MKTWEFHYCIKIIDNHYEPNFYLTLEPEKSEYFINTSMGKTIEDINYSNYRKQTTSKNAVKI